MNNWNLLNIKLKAAYIKLAVAKGIRTLADVITDYENNDNQAYLYYNSTLPPNQQDPMLNLISPHSSDFLNRKYWELNGKPKDWREASKRGMFTLESDGLYHANSVAENPTTGDIEFMKSKDHPTVDLELLNYYNNPDLSDFRSNYDLDISGDYYKYTPKKNKFDGWKNSTMDLANDQYHYIALQEAEKKRLNFLRNIQFYLGKNKPLPNSLFWLLNNPGVEIVGAGSKSNPVRLPDVNVIGLSAATRAYNAQLPYLNNLDTQELYRTEVNKADAKARRINEGWENLVLGGWAMPSQFIGAALRNNPWTSLGYGKGNGFFQDWLVGNGGVTTDNFNAEHPYLSTAANLGFDMFIPAIGKTKNINFNLKRNNSKPRFVIADVDYSGAGLSPKQVDAFQEYNFWQLYNDLIYGRQSMPIHFFGDWNMTPVNLTDYPEVVLNFINLELGRLLKNRVKNPLTVDVQRAFPEKSKQILKFYDPESTVIDPRLDKDVQAYIKNNKRYPQANLNTTLKINTFNDSFWDKYNNIYSPDYGSTIGFYDPKSNTIALRENFNPQTLAHELRHRLDDAMPLNTVERAYLDEAYRLAEFERNFPNYDNIAKDKVTTNRDAREKLYEYVGGKKPELIDEQNAMIDKASLFDIEDAVRESNGYGQAYIEEINKLPKEEKELILENIRQAMKYVGAGTGVGIGVAAANGLNINKYGGSLSKMKKNNNYAKGGYLRLLAINNFFKKHANKFSGEGDSNIEIMLSPEFDENGYPLPIRFVRVAQVNGLLGVNPWNGETYGNSISVTDKGMGVSPKVIRDYHYAKEVPYNYVVNNIPTVNGLPYLIKDKAYYTPEATPSQEFTYIPPTYIYPMLLRQNPFEEEEFYGKYVYPEDPDYNNILAIPDKEDKEGIRKIIPDTRFKKPKNYYTSSETEKTINEGADVALNIAALIPAFSTIARGVKAAKTLKFVKRLGEIAKGSLKYLATTEALKNTPVLYNGLIRGEEYPLNTYELIASAYNKDKDEEDQISPQDFEALVNTGLIFSGSGLKAMKLKKAGNILNNITGWNNFDNAMASNYRYFKPYLPGSPWYTRLKPNGVEALKKSGLIGSTIGADLIANDLLEKALQKYMYPLYYYRSPALHKKPQIVNAEFSPEDIYIMKNLELSPTLESIYQNKFFEEDPETGEYILK